AAPAIGARERHTATLLDRGDVLIAGGRSGTLGGPAGTAERYHPVSQGFAATASLLTPRARHTATRLDDDTVLVAGGEGAGGALLDSGEIFDPSGTPVDSVEILDGTTGAPRAASGNLMKPRAGASAVTLADGRIFIAGGVGLGGTALDTAEVYDPRRERSNGGVTMSKAR